MAIEYMTTDVPMDWESSFMTTELLAQTGFGLHSGDRLSMAALSTMDQAQHEDNEPMDWQPQSPTDTGLVTPLSTFSSFPATSIARLSGAFIIRSFPLPQPLNQEAANLPYPELVFFVDSIIRRADLPDCVSFGALRLLHRLGGTRPAGWSDRELFFIAFIVASKILCDDSYYNREWCNEVTCGLYALEEINEMEKAFCHCMRWNLAIGQFDLDIFTAVVWTAFNAFI